MLLFLRYHRLKGHKNNIQISKPESGVKFVTHQKKFQSTCLNKLMLHMFVITIIVQSFQIFTDQIQEQNTKMIVMDSQKLFGLNIQDQTLTQDLLKFQKF